MGIEDKFYNPGPLSESEAHDEANLIRGYLLRHGKKPEDFTSEDFDWAMSQVAGIKELAKSESNIEHFAKMVVLRLGNVALMPVLLVAAVLDALAKLPAQDRSYWGQKNKPKAIDAVLAASDELRKAYENSGLEQLAEVKSAAKGFEK